MRLRRCRPYRCAPATPLQKRRKNLAERSLTTLLDNPREMSSQQAIRRRYSVVDRVPADLIMGSADGSNNMTASPVSDALSSFPSHDFARAAQEDDPDSTRTRQSSTSSTSSMPPPPAPREDGPARRGHRRAQSSVCRHVNRLSLTLPIAPPTSDPSRPTPTTTKSSVPPTPADSTAASPADANEFIIAVAAQERRVLELREELARAEADLHKLKKKWTGKDATRKRAEQRQTEALRSTGPRAEDEATRRSVDLERRKLFEQSQGQPATPQGRRKVFRGGHTRTLSLLSPAKDSGFSLHEDGPDLETVQLPTIERRAAQLTNPNLAKRASWQPRSQQSIPGVNVPVPRIMEDFKLGFRAFVEDIRQITVGDEPINGQLTGSTSVDLNGSNQDTIRPSHPLRPKVSTVFEPPHSADSTPTTGNKAEAPKDKQDNKPKGKAKHFSWTPLAVDALDDNDWSNWESPSSSKTSRWSGSTMGSSIDDMPDDEPQTTTPS